MVRSRKSGFYRNIGLLFLRIGLGFMLILHGYPKVFGGPEKWEEVGQTIQFIGTDFAPMFFGFATGIAEFFGGIFLILGLFFTPTLLFLIAVFLVTATSQISQGDDFSNISHTIELIIVFISMFFLGTGKHSLDSKLTSRRRRY